MRLLPLILVGFALALTPALAQDKPADNEAIVRAKLQADKKLIVADNMQLTETEAKGFWPVYDAYQADLQKANNRIMALINSYAEVYRNNQLTDERAGKLLDEKLAIEEVEAQRDRTFAPKLTAVLPTRKVVRYLQIEARVRALVRYEISNNIPLMQ